MIIIRHVVTADAEAILKIYAPFITDTSISFETEVPKVEKFSERIEEIIKSYPYLVCEIDGNVLGFAYASRHRERAAYRFSADVSIYVSLLYHRRGIGKAMYTKLFDFLRQQGIHTVYAGITIPNDASNGFHKSLGFSEVGTYHNVGYKHGKWHDVLWLEKPLSEYNDPEADKF